MCADGVIRKKWITVRLLKVSKKYSVNLSKKTIRYLTSLSGFVQRSVCLYQDIETEFFNPYGFRFVRKNPILLCIYLSNTVYVDKDMRRSIVVDSYRNCCQNTWKDNVEGKNIFHINPWKYSTKAANKLCDELQHKLQFERYHLRYQRENGNRPNLSMKITFWLMMKLGCVKYWFF